MILDALNIACTRLLLAGSLVAGAFAAIAQDTAASAEKLRQFMEQVRPQPTSPQTAPQTASQIGNPAVLTAKTVAPARLQERVKLLKTGESALALWPLSRMCSNSAGVKLHFLLTASSFKNRL